MMLFMIETGFLIQPVSTSGSFRVEFGASDMNFELRRQLRKAKLRRSEVGPKRIHVSSTY